MPTESAAAARVFWDPACCPAVLPVVASPARGLANGWLAQTVQKGWSATCLSMPDGTHHLLLRSGSRTVQLVGSGLSLSSDIRLAIELNQDSRLLKARIASFEGYNLLCTGGRIPLRQFPTLQYRRRLCAILRALDGWHGGASHREIAIALVGERRVSADWRDPRRHLQDIVRRAIGRGRTLMNRSYLTFLS